MNYRGTCPFGNKHEGLFRLSAWKPGPHDEGLRVDNRVVLCCSRPPWLSPGMDWANDS